MPDPITGSIAAVSAGSSIAGGAMKGRAAKRAASAQVAAAAEATRLQREMYAQQQAMQDPYRQAGLTGQNRMMELMGLGGNANAQDYGRYGRDFAMSDYEADPGYAFRLAEGNKALERSAAARGMVLSGSMFKGLQRYGQDMASQEYQNAFNRYQTNRSNQLNPLAGLMASGQGAANVLTGAAGQLGTQIGENAMGAGNARASGYVGSANAYADAVSGVSNAFGDFMGQRAGGMAPKPGMGG